MDRNLEAFLAVARSRTLTEAAETLNLTQPTLTKRIANLEASMGVRLFDRHRRGMKLTAAGASFLDRAARIEREFSQAKEEVQALTSAGMPILRVGAGPLFHLIYIAPLFTQLRQRFPRLPIELVADTNIRTIPRLLNHELDLVMGVIESSSDTSLLVTHTLTEVEHGIVMPPGHPLAQSDAVDPSDFKATSWVLYTEDPDTEDLISSHYQDRGLAPPGFDVRTNSFATGLQLVLQGGFVMSAPRQLRSVIETAGLAIRPVRHGMPKRKAGLHYRASSRNTAAIQSVREIMQGLFAPKHQPTYLK